MKIANAASIRWLVAVGVPVGFAALLSATPVHGQGCAPSRFNFRGFRREGDVYLGRGTWQVAFGYRRLTSSKLIQGTEEIGPGSSVKSQSIYTGITYGVSNHLAVTLNVPFSSGRHETGYPDKQRHVNTVTGLNDISLLASYSLVSALRPGSNFAIGGGVRIPTGKNDVMGTWWLKDSTTVAFPAHQSIQLGDGGWGLMLAVQGFQPISSRLSVHGGGAYSLNPKKTTDVVRSPTDSTHWAVPDTWDAVVGVGVQIWPQQGFSASLEGILHGTPRRDLIGGKDGDGHRLPATSGYLNPAVQLIRGAHMFTLGVPIRVYKDFRPSLLDDAAGKKGGGGLAKYVILAQYIVRF